MTSKQEFQDLVQQIQNTKGYKSPLAFAIAKVDLSQQNPQKTIGASMPVVNWNENFGSAAIFLHVLSKRYAIDYESSEQVFDLDQVFVDECLELFAPFIDEVKGDAHKNIQTLLELKQHISSSNCYRVVFMLQDTTIKSLEMAYLKLYALSLKKVLPRSIVLDGAFLALPNVAWSGNQPYDLDYLRANEIHLKFTGEYPAIDYVDKFPRYLMHIIPEDNVRILDASKVRFGAHLGAGTTIMPGASYVNFNAGTLGAAMVEGRISSSAVVGEGSDIGGGASILGVLSGTDGNPISIGANCLLGANSTCGVPLGDGCIIDGGLAIFAGTKLHICEEELQKINEANPDMPLPKKDTFKAQEIANLNGLHFRQDSQTGRYVLKRSTRAVKLNKDLH